MRISDWSSDVCSSDLWRPAPGPRWRTGSCGSSMSPFRQRQCRHHDDQRPPARGDDKPERAFSTRTVAGPAHADAMLAACRTGSPESCPSSAIRWSRSEEKTSELQSLMTISYAVVCLTKKTIYEHKE